MNNGFESFPMIAKRCYDIMAGPESEGFCIVCGDKNTCGHHVYAIGSGGGRKDWENARHLTQVPLCSKHHTELHGMTISEFEKKHSVNIWAEVSRWLIYVVSGQYLGFKGYVGR